ncbi:MAG: peptidase M50 [Angelakisella sp.]
MAAAFYYLDRQGILPWAVLACASHELGHCGAVYLLGGRVCRIRLSAVGAEMVLSAAHPMGHGAQLISALAGPLANLLLAFCAARIGEGLYLLAGLNLGLACFNLLPAAQLDGGRALEHLAALLWSQRLGEGLVRALSAATVLCLLTAGAAVLWKTGTNFTLIVTAIWLAMPFFRRKSTFQNKKTKMYLH